MNTEAKSANAPPAFDRFAVMCFWHDLSVSTCTKLSTELALANGFRIDELVEIHEYIAARCTQEARALRHYRDSRGHA